MAAIFYFEDTLDPQWIRRGIYHAGSCVIGLTNNKKPALGGLGEAQTLRSFLMATSDNKPAMLPSSHSGLAGTGGFTGIVADNKARPELSERRFLPSVCFAASRGALISTIIECPTFQKARRVTVLAV